MKNYGHKTNNASKSRLIMPIMSSILVHAVIIALVYYTQKSNKLPNDKRVETSLISPEQLSQLQSKAQRRLQNIDQNTNQLLKQDERSKYREYQPTKIANPSDYTQTVQKTVQNTSPTNPNHNIENDENMTDNDLTSKFSNRFNTDTTNNLNHEINDEIPNEFAKTSGLDIDVADLTAEINNQHIVADPTLATNNQQNRQKNSTQTSANKLANANDNASILTLFQQHLVLPKGIKPQTLTLHVTINITGKIIKATATGATPEVNQAAEDAAYNIGTLSKDLIENNYPNFSLQIHAKDFL